MCVVDLKTHFVCMMVRHFLRSCLLFACCFSVHFVTAGVFAQSLPLVDGQSQSQETSAILVAEDVNDQTWHLKKTENPWGSFLPGTWVVRRTSSWQFADNSVVSNATDTLLILESVDKNRITLRQETAIEIENGTFVKPDPKQVLLDFNMQPFSEEGTIVLLQPQTVVVARRQIVCQVLRYTQYIGDQKKTTTLWHSDTIMPYLFRLEEIRTQISNSAEKPETVLSHSIMTVTDTSGIRLFKNLLNDYKTQTIKKNASGTVVSQASHSTNIPGGLLREVTVETDTDNKIVGRSVTSVLDYFVACPGTPVRQPRLYSEASKEIQSNWNNITNQNSNQTP